MGHTTLGYGYINSDGGRNGRNLRVPRVVWELTKGPIPDGLCVMHRCDNKRCVNPDHLELGTIAQNTRDAVTRGQINLESQRRPGTQNGRAKISETDVRAIREEYERNMGAAYVKRGMATSLSKRFGLDPEVIRRIAKRKTWTHVA